MAKILNGFDQKSKEALSRALIEEFGIQTVLNERLCWPKCVGLKPNHRTPWNNQESH